MVFKIHAESLGAEVEQAVVVNKEGEGRELLKNVKPSPEMPINRELPKG